MPRLLLVTRCMSGKTEIGSDYYRPQSKFVGKVMFLYLSVIHSIHSGVAILNRGDAILSRGVAILSRGDAILSRGGVPSLAGQS